MYVKHVSESCITIQTNDDNLNATTSNTMLSDTN